MAVAENTMLVATIIAENCGTYRVTETGEGRRRVAVKYVSFIYIFIYIFMWLPVWGLHVASYEVMVPMISANFILENVILCRKTSALLRN